jgi:hypothetical protein
MRQFKIKDNFGEYIETVMISIVFKKYLGR